MMFSKTCIGFWFKIKSGGLGEIEGCEIEGSLIEGIGFSNATEDVEKMIST